MNTMETRARTRVPVLDTLNNVELEPGREGQRNFPETRGRSAARARTLSPPIDPTDEAQAVAACKPMGELEYVVRSVDAKGHTRVQYVIIPDIALKPHYARLGLTIEEGCRVLVDATEMKAIAVLSIVPRLGKHIPPTPRAATAYNPYFDIQSA